MKTWAWLTISLLLAGAVATFVILYVKEKNKNTKSIDSTIKGTKVQSPTTGEIGTVTETISETGERKNVVKNSNGTVIAWVDKDGIKWSK